MENTQQKHPIILDFIEKTSQPVFLTGKAGTGKTTLLRKIQASTSKNFAVIAPTAVAAINAGGVTMHSFFQIPFGPLIPTETVNQPSIRYAPDKVKLLKCLELLVIDEISMVRADTLDFIDAMLRKVRGSVQPFGGVQVLMIGDLYQLSPVFHDAWHLLKEYYASPYFFESQVFRQINILTFELDHVYRQSDPVFIDMLNHIRRNTMPEQLLEKLNERYDAALDVNWKEGYITLTTHNQLVTEINNTCLNRLDGELQTFKAVVNGDFPKDAYPADEELLLKNGAQIMFIKNDSSGKKQFYNGRAAKIIHLTENHIQVEFIDDQTTLDVQPEIWHNIKYTLDPQENKITENNTGSFSQYPFKLAWAITIHKSQGLTFDKAIVDVGAAFAHGQTYVALSRCRSLEGLVLKTPVKPANILTDERVIQFTHNAVQEQPDAGLLDRYSRAYGRVLITDLFDFSTLKTNWDAIGRILKKHDQGPAFAQIYEEIKKVLEEDLLKIGDRFIRQELSKYPAGSILQEENAFLVRMEKAAGYFTPKIAGEIENCIRLINLRIYNDQHSDNIINLVNDVLATLATKQALFNLSWASFSIDQYRKAMRKAGSNYEPVQRELVKEIPAKAPEPVANPALYQELVKWRKAISVQRNLPDYKILPDQALILVAAKLPKTTEQLSAIKGIGVGNAVDFGSQIIKCVNAYLGTSELF